MDKGFILLWDTDGGGTGAVQKRPSLRTKLVIARIQSKPGKTDITYI